MAAGKAIKNMTPGRRRKAQDQYFDVGKVGRKTGITLPDKGIRDEYGMEPVSGIFSSPVSPQRTADRTLTSDDMHLQDSSAPEVEQTLHLRKTPKLPPPRAGTPKHTNIGSPKRMSTGRPHTTGKPFPLDDNATSPSRNLSKTQPPANRKLDFSADGVRPSIEAIVSPFKAKNKLRRSVGPAPPRRDVFASPEPVAKPVLGTSGSSEEEEREEEQEEEEEPEEPLAELQPADDGPLLLDDGPLLLDDDDGDGYGGVTEEMATEMEEVQAEVVLSSPSRRKPGRPRKSIESTNDSQIEHMPPVANVTPGKKRNRTSMESEQAEDEGSTSAERLEAASASASPVQKKPRGRPPKDKVVVHREEQDETIDPQLLAYDDEHESAEPRETSVQPQKKGGSKQGKASVPKERDPNRAIRAATSPVKLHDGPSRGSMSPSKRGKGRAGSMGPVSNVNLRASTPFEDAGFVSRSGRPILKPLQYWANETRVWKNGEVEGIVRAEEATKPQHANKGRKKKKKSKKSTKGVSRLEDIDEESETESTLADEWEEEVGVIAGTVANWDAATQNDLGFASSSIITRDVAGSDFKYAKIMTLPFFGSGLVELPPAGFKRAKNSRKMQMCFFVYEGKVMVEIGAQGNGEVNQFAISKGGVWVVPRGNNYAITNESRTKTASIFFAQGCEVDAPAPAPAADAAKHVGKSQG
ncbi:hypothetical protein LTR36_000251 [Oleoguttula mirabilis]|uniref:Mif2/CENP-C cupin domain-containing protein n=1 Tax=Oleoguttula mirabilis TaxID=1507867 RepID=A0AAV9K025_9PEZI|nr:hypothetical protein LTR36_000251 [Oleoguttula mirabilis]